MNATQILAGKLRHFTRGYPLRLHLFSPCLLLILLQLPALAALSPEHLSCEYLTNPQGIDTPQPRLSWVLESNQRAQRQTAYQILVASTETRLHAGNGDLWDTGRVLSDQTLHLPYQPVEIL